MDKTEKRKVTKHQLIKLMLGLLMINLILILLLAFKTHSFNVIRPGYIYIVILLSFISLGMFLIFKKFNSDFFKYMLYQISDFLWILVVAITVMQFFFTYLFFPAVVNQTSMYPTFEEKEKLLIRATSKVERFDIVVVEVDERINNLAASYVEKTLWEKFRELFVMKNDPGLNDKDLIIKRVIALPGETFYFDENGVLWVDGVSCVEDFLPNITINDVYMVYKTTPLPDNCYFVMGDNRANSQDSRHIGYIEKQQIVGIAKYRIKNLITYIKIE